MTCRFERRKKKTNDHTDVCSFSVKRSFGDDQRLSSRKNNGQGKKTRTNEQFIKE
jgi:hypothetical protein